MPASVLETLARRYMEFQAAARRAARRYDQRVLEQMLQLPELTRQRPRIRGVSANGAASSSGCSTGEVAGRSYRVTLQSGPSAHLLIARIEHGSTTEKHLHREFFSSSEYRRIAELARTLSGFSVRALVKKGEATQEAGSFREALHWLLDQARRGQTIQRYKGLGEMNPGQLWDTTINPETRRLMQVRIDDATAQTKFLHADGRSGRAATRVHRAQRAVGGLPRRLSDGAGSHERRSQLIVFQASFEKLLCTPAEFTALTAKYQVAGARSSTVTLVSAALGSDSAWEY